jgi:hypothetical protein
MSASTTYINFSSIDYTGKNSLSTFSLGLTPLKFIPELPNTYNHRVIWDFGDGTISKSFSTNKVYDFPGKYNIKLIVYDCNNNAMISTFEKTISVYDYIPYTFNIHIYNYIATEDGTYIISEDGTYLVDESIDLSLKCGKIEGPFMVNTYYPPYQSASSIYYSISGSDSLNYWTIQDNKYSHLQKFNTLYTEIYNYAISSYQYKEIDKIDFTSTKVYGKLHNNSIVLCDPLESGAEWVGSMASKNFYIKNDSITSKMLIDFWFDKNNSDLPTTKLKYLNNLGISLSCNVVNNDASKLTITSNGLDGEGYPVESFNINSIKFFNTKIPFVIKIKDSDHMSIKNFDTIQLSSLNIVILNVSDVQLETENGEWLLNELGEGIYAEGIINPLSSSCYSITSLNYQLSSQSIGGSFRGYIEFPYNNTNLIQNVKIFATGSFVNDQLSSYSLSGESNYFNVYAPNYFDIWKKNEDFNPTQTLKDLRFQEILIDKNVLFDDFFSEVFGNESSDHDAIGVKIYEKIANFVENTQDIDKCEGSVIGSLGKFIGYNDENEETYIYPENINRVINLASMDTFKLVGNLNKFNQNFDIRGHSSKDEYGTNIGSIINPKTYIIDKNVPIVALEKFSNSYILLNTYQPVSAGGPSNYALSTYNASWGWPLVLPTSFNVNDFEKYYLFFEYNEGYDNTSIGGVVDFKNNKTTIEDTITHNELMGDGGVFEHIFLDTLYQSLSLVK